MDDRSKILATKASLLFNCIVIVGVLFYLYQRTTLHRWDNALVSVPILLNFVLILVLKRLNKHQEQNV
ncbi:MAG TPA: hypothetical protein VK638_17410 [Edaphobacter sp.]|nr:hypothetical protein [Edaphobacter sp.]